MDAGKSGGGPGQGWLCALTDQEAPPSSPLTGLGSLGGYYWLSSLGQVT